jgi:hypothetical protein
MIGASARLAWWNRMDREGAAFLTPVANREALLVRALLEDCFELTALVRELGLGQCRWLPQMFRE